MNVVKRFALLLANSDQPFGWPEGAVEVNLYLEEIETGMEDGDWEYDYIGVGFGNATGKVTQEEFETFVAQNPNFKEEYEVGLKQALAELAEISKTIGENLDRGFILSKEFGVDFDIELSSGRVIPTEKLGRVDWNSSSLDC